MTFAEELTNLINRYSRENISNTPDLILAEFMLSALASFEDAVWRRDRWYGISPKPGGVAAEQEGRKDD